MKIKVRVFGALAGLFLLASCGGGHGLCDAYSYYDYKKETHETPYSVETEELTENGTI